jgi:hypothetical protein
MAEIGKKVADEKVVILIVQGRPTTYAFSSVFDPERHGDGTCPIRERFPSYVPLERILDKTFITMGGSCCDVAFGGITVYPDSHYIPRNATVSRVSQR